MRPRIQEIKKSKKNPMKNFYLLLVFISGMCQLGTAQLIEKLPDRSPQNTEVISTYQLRTVLTKADIDAKWEEMKSSAEHPASLLKSSDGCNALLVRGLHGWDLINGLKATSISCLDNFMLKDYPSIRDAYTYDNFRNVYHVLDEIQTLAGSYNGVNDAGMGQLIYFVRSYLYWTWTEEELRFSGESDPLYQKIIETFRLVANRTALFTSKDPSNAPVLEQFLIAIDFQQPLEGGGNLTYRGQFLDAVVNMLGEISADKIFAIEDKDTRKAFLGAYSRLNFYLFRGSFVPGQSDAGLEAAINNNPQFYVELERILKDEALLNNSESSFFICDLAGELGRLASMLSQRDKVAELAQEIIKLLPENSVAWLSLLDKYTNSAEVDQLGTYNLDEVKENIYNMLFPYTYEFDGGALVMKTGLPIETAMHQYHAAKMVQAQFFRMSQTTEPVPGDENETLIMQVYSTLSDYKNYQTFLTGIGTNNGGMYIEGDGIFYTYERTPEESTYTLEELFRHEYVHYLQGRYIFQGLWGSEFFAGNRLTWFEEGQAECCTWSSRENGMLVRGNIIGGLVSDQGDYMTLDEVMHSTMANGFHFYKYACVLMYYFLEHEPEKLNLLIDAGKAYDIEAFDSLVKKMSGDATMQNNYNKFLDGLIAKYKAGELSDPSTSWVKENRLTCNNQQEFIETFQNTTGLEVLSDELIQESAYPRIALTVELTSQPGIERIAAANEFNDQLDNALTQLNDVTDINNFLYTNAYYGKLVTDGSVYTTTAVFDGPFRAVATGYDTDGDGVVDAEDDFPDDYLGYDDANGNGVLDNEEMPDEDGDGMPDGWECRYNLDPANPDDADRDADGDFNSNLFEWKHGTDPTDVASNTPVGDLKNKFWVEEDRRHITDYENGKWIGVGWSPSDEALPLKNYTGLKLRWETSKPIKITAVDDVNFDQDQDLSANAEFVTSGVIEFPDFNIDDHNGRSSNWFYLYTYFEEEGYLQVKMTWETDVLESDLSNNVVEDYFIIGDVVATELVVPSQLTATVDQFIDRVELTWNVVENATGYSVYRANMEDFSDAVELAEIEIMNYADNSVELGVDYFYRVQALNANASSNLSFPVTGRALLPIPVTPLNFQAELNTEGDVSAVLNWDEVLHATSYQIYRSLDAQMSNVELLAQVTTEEYVDQISQSQSDVFFYQVVAVNAKGESLPSEVASVTKVISAVKDFGVVDGLTIVQEINQQQTMAILTTQAKGMVSIRIFNVVGECVYTGQQNKDGNQLVFKVPATHLKPGLFIITMQINNSEYVQKFRF